MLYSIYALYASGKDAVMGGMLVMGVAFIIWGFIANRFTAAPSGAPPARRCEGNEETITMQRMQRTALHWHCPRRRSPCFRARPRRRGHARSHQARPATSASAT